MGSQAIAGEIAGEYDYDTKPAALVSHWLLHGGCRVCTLLIVFQSLTVPFLLQAVACTACIAVVTFFLMLHRLRYPDFSHLWHVSIYTVAIVAVPGELGDWDIPLALRS